MIHSYFKIEILAIQNEFVLSGRKGLSIFLRLQFKYLSHRVIILLERACLHNRIGRNWCNVTAWRHSRLRVHWLMYWLSGGGLRGNSPGIAASPIALLSMVALEKSVGGAYRRENSLHWKANMLPLFNIMTLWSFTLLCHQNCKYRQMSAWCNKSRTVTYQGILINTGIPNERQLRASVIYSK